MDSPVPQNKGSLFQVLVANPAAGADWVYQLPANYRYQLQSILFRLTTDATVLARHVGISVYTLAQMHFLTEYRNWQAATLVIDYCTFPGAFDFLAALSLTQITSIPTNFMIRAGDLLGSETLNLAATDQFVNIVIDFLRWPERSA